MEQLNKCRECDHYVFVTDGWQCRLSECRFTQRDLGYHGWPCAPIAMAIIVVVGVIIGTVKLLWPSMKCLIFALLLASCAKTDIQPDPAPSMAVRPHNRLPNGGGDGTTDWHGTNIAQGWRVLNQITTPSIVTYMGDRSQVVSSPSQFVLISPMPEPVSGVKHRMTFRYQATTNFIVVVRYSDRCGYRIYEGTPSHEWTEVDTEFWAPKIVCVMWYNRPNEGGELRIDNVNVY